MSSCSSKRSHGALLYNGGGPNTFTSAAIMLSTASLPPSGGSATVTAKVNKGSNKPLKKMFIRKSEIPEKIAAERKLFQVNNVVHS